MLAGLGVEREQKRSGSGVDDAVAVADAAVAEDVTGLGAAADLVGDVVIPQQMAGGRVERVHAAARIGHVHHTVHHHRRRLIADAVDDAVLKQPPRRERLHVRGVDLIERRVAAAEEIEVVQRPVHVLRRRGENRTLG
jgi:hypothetical protein